MFRLLPRLHCRWGIRRPSWTPPARLRGRREEAVRQLKGICGERVRPVAVCTLREGMFSHSRPTVSLLDVFFLVVLLVLCPSTNCHAFQRSQKLSTGRYSGELVRTSSRARSRTCGRPQGWKWVMHRATVVMVRSSCPLLSLTSVADDLAATSSRRQETGGRPA